MALIIEKEFETGLKVEKSYCRVLKVICDQSEVCFDLEIYLNKESRLLYKKPLDTLSYSFKHDVSESAPNVIKQAYEYLKTLDEYKTSYDDLDI